MSLQVWLPLNGNLNNQGLGNITLTSGTPSFKQNGKIGQCFDLNTRVNFNCPELNGLTTFSIAFWAKVNEDASLSTNWVDVIGFIDQKSDNSATGQLRWETCYGSGYTTRGISYHDNATYAISNLAVTSGSDPVSTKGIWEHLAFVVTSSTIYAYRQGILKATYAPNGGHLTGAFWLGQAGVMNGELNDVRIYDHALSTKEVKELSKGLILHYKLDNNGLGNPNLLDNTNQGSNYWLQSYGNGAGSLISDGIAAKYNITTQSTNWQVFAFKPSNNAAVMNSLSTAGKIYTLSFDIYSTSSFTTSPSYRDGNSQNNLITWPSFTTIANQWYHYEGSATTIGGTISNQEIYINYKVPIGTYIFKNLKLEEGNKATPWSPYVNTDTIYDVSGYNCAATANAITWSSSSPRYNAAANFNGSSSYIKVDDNSWMAQGSTALTVNIWAYMNDWASWNGHRLYSCTEGGGFNIENTVTNSLTFPVCVYTNAGQTSTAYIDTNSRVAILKTDIAPGWHMFTYIYETTGCSCYLDGELYQTKPYTSYGIYYNINGSRLFLGCEANGTNPSGPYFNGQESDFRIYATALSVDDIKELYNTSAAIDKDGNIYAREFVNTGIVSNYQINKRGQMIPVNQFIERDEKLASIEKSNNVLGGQFYEY